MKPIFKIGEHDYTAFLEKLSPVKNDLDADGSGRNILDGLMYRSRSRRRTDGRQTSSRSRKRFRCRCWKIFARSMWTL